MNRHSPYTDASVNRYAASQMPQMSAQKMQQNAVINEMSGQPHFPSRADGQHQWDTNPQIELNPMSPPSYSQGHKGNVAQSLSQERILDRKVNYESQPNNDPRFQSYEQDMEIGYEDNKPSESTFEGLERKFQDETMKLIKELSDAEDAENARHRERIIEINTRYQENLSSLRVQQATRIREFLHKESQARLHQYQQTAMSMQLAATEPRDYGWATAAEPPRPYGTAPRDHPPQYHGAARRSQSQSSEVRVPFPQGRVYNNSGAHF